eukprot:49774-Prorocentrum_minimum.AAC.1
MRGEGIRLLHFTGPPVPITARVLLTPQRGEGRGYITTRRTNQMRGDGVYLHSCTLLVLPSVRISSQPLSSEFARKGLNAGGITCEPGNYLFNHLPVIPPPEPQSAARRGPPTPRARPPAPGVGVSPVRRVGICFVGDQ